ncbi:hypothetical protein EX30DRAFT_338752 [Ascodesmis nigricans]|uniref:Transcription elongation factor Eaf N-terminal domain-containing protein n=1 Tax=Ascodesmis nigricans TaxID=341454 RepID=A0A4V3SJI3_9PEZI|nr:hypothetical protein EX30DRAFT_338752 [Ascodesmis nigricans]
MPPQPQTPSAPLLRVDRPGTYNITLGSSISEPSTFQSIKYNHKPKSTRCNPSDPLLKPGPSPSTYNLVFTPSASAKIQYVGSGAHPPPRRQHFLLYDPTTKQLTLERLDTALVFNADVFATAHPPLPRELSEDEDEDSDDDAGGAYDFQNFLGKKKKTAAEERQERRLQALKRAGRAVVEVEADPEPEKDVGAAVGSTHSTVPERRYGRDGEGDSEMDAPGEEDDNEDGHDEDTEIPDIYAAAAAASTQKATQRLPKSPDPPVPTAAPIGLGLDYTEHDPDVLILPDPVVHGREDEDADGEEELEFSDEDEDDPVPPPPLRPLPQKEPTPPPLQQDDEEVDDFDFLGNELEAALGGADDGLIIEDEEEEAPPQMAHNPADGPRSLNQGGASYLDASSDSESEEE